MGEKHDNPQAFPGQTNGIVTGMSLRDYFAGQALAGLAAHDESNVEWLIEFGTDASYDIADAMLEARNA